MTAMRQERRTTRKTAEPRAGRSSSPARPTRSCSTARSSPTASRSARSRRSSRPSSRSSLARPSLCPASPRAGSRTTTAPSGRSRSARASRSTTARRSTPRRSASTSTAGTTSRARSQSPAASYYWQVVFGGFANYDEDSGAPEESLYESCEATDATTAVLTLTKPSATFIPALSQQAFSIASPKALQEFKADEGTLDADGVFSRRARSAPSIRSARARSSSSPGRAATGSCWSATRTTGARRRSSTS